MKNIDNGIIMMDRKGNSQAKSKSSATTCAFVTRNRFAVLEVHFYFVVFLFVFVFMSILAQFLIFLYFFFRFNLTIWKMTVKEKSKFQKEQ